VYDCRDQFSVSGDAITSNWSIKRSLEIEVFLCSKIWILIADRIVRSCEKSQF
jgi:hypothetical protein